MVVLLEVVPQRDGDERAAVRDELHGRRQAALDDGEVAAGERAKEVVHVPDGRHPLDRLDRRRIDARPADQQ